MERGPRADNNNNSSFVATSSSVSSPQMPSAQGQQSSGAPSSAPVLQNSVIPLINLRENFRKELMALLNSVTQNSSDFYSSR
jgi:hypothetical protein